MTEQAYFELRGRAHKRGVWRYLQNYCFMFFFGFKFPLPPPPPGNTLSPGFVFPGNSVDWYFSNPLPLNQFIRLCSVTINCFRFQFKMAEKVFYQET